MQEQKEQKEERSPEKTKRLAVALTVAGTLVALFLLVILLIQFVQIGVKNARLNGINEQIREVEEMKAEDQKDLDFYLTEQGLYYKALELGWSRSGK